MHNKAFGSLVLIEDGSYLRLKQLVFSYNIPTVNMKSVESFRVFLQGANLLTFTSYSGIDPEISNDNNVNGDRADLDMGVDRAQYPVVKSVQVGLGITF